MNRQKIHARLVGARFQALAFTLSLIVITVLLTIRYRSFVNLDPIYPIEQNKPNETSSMIKVGFHITQFNKFYVAQNDFEVLGTIWFAYDPSRVSLDIIKQFSIYNGELVEISEPSMAKTAEKTIAHFRVQIKFHTSLYYLLFPLDDHCINIIVTNDFLPHNVMFTSSDNILTLDPSLELPGWHIMNTQAKAGFTHFLPTSLDSSEKSSHQKAVFSLFLEHNNPMLTINIVLTLLLLLFTTLLTFSSEEDCVLIVSIGMVALIGYRFVLQAFEPIHINYFTLADYMYLFALIGAILTLFFGIFTRERNSSVATKEFIIAGIYVVFIGGCSLLSFIL